MSHDIAFWSSEEGRVGEKQRWKKRDRVSQRQRGRKTQGEKIYETYFIQVWNTKYAALERLLSEEMEQNHIKIKAKTK